jgi:hypothetical protein
VTSTESDVRLSSDEEVLTLDMTIEGGEVTSLFLTLVGINRILRCWCRTCGCPSSSDHCWKEHYLKNITGESYS